MVASSDVETLVIEGKRHLFSDMKNAREQATEYGMIRNPTPYENACALFRKALKLSPEHKRASEGLEACMEMLTPLVPIQTLGGIEDVRTPPAESEIFSAENQNITPSVAPWELRRRLRARMRADMANTGHEFSDATRRAMEKAEKWIEEARMLVENKTWSAEEAYKVYQAKLKTFQETLNQSWKGHGPPIYPVAHEKLLKTLGISNSE